MALDHLVPHLDAEIERLQTARDLLALFILFQESLTTIDAERAIVEHGSAIPAATVETEESVDALVSGPASRVPEIRRIKMRRPRIAREQARLGRIRDPMADTALRGSVPAGPIVVSAADVLRSQASKTAQATRAAEVRRAGTEFVSSAAWRDRSNGLRHVDAMLQRLINIGEEEAEQAKEVRLPAMS